jgi:hypothetical protein
VTTKQNAQGKCDTLHREFLSSVPTMSGRENRTQFLQKKQQPEKSAVQFSI